MKSANTFSKVPHTTLLFSMARTKSGRITLMKYRNSSDIFATSGGTQPNSIY